MDNVYVVKFYTEYGDHYVAAFKDKPTDGHLSAYVKKKYPEAINKKTGERYIFWEVTKVPIQKLPKFIDPIKAI